MSGTSNERLPLLTGKQIPLHSDIDHGKWTSEEQHLSKATKILCSHLMLLYRGYTVHAFNVNHLFLAYLNSKKSGEAIVTDLCPSWSNVNIFT